MYYQKLSGSVDVCRIQTYIINNSLFVYFYNIYECNWILYPPCLPVSASSLFITLLLLAVVAGGSKTLHKLYLFPLYKYFEIKNTCYIEMNSLHSVLNAQLFIIYE